VQAINTLVNSLKRKRALRFLFVVACAGFIIMSATVLYAIVFGNLFIEGPQLVDMPWGLVSLVDIYLGLMLFSLWVIWREEYSPIGLLWMILIISLGNMISCIYIIKACWQAEGNISKFWLGSQMSKL